ncbi:hypothetical protein Fmac_016012 [Flemingia macrophylla]|uniref:F-box domain-containing protein n=1 Tax=Flemingia macrophylla TaxID=520843 RepID=A0ABD1MG67_9FABA
MVTKRGNKNYLRKGRNYVVGEGSNLRGKEKEKRDKEDRLSNLPDELIHRILSTIDAKSCVQMSVLSKRWRNLWTTLPVLNLQDTSFSDPVLFESFVDHVLSHRDSSTNLHVVNFESYDDLQEGDVVDSIIDYITDTPTVTASIRLLSILADQCVVGSLPDLSLCQSLTTLNLSRICAEATPFEIVSLKSLYLIDCNFECGDEEVLDLFEDCVNLRRLSLHNCNYYGGFQTFRIHAPQLTYLSISWMRIDEMFNSNCDIELFTPKLQHFSYSDSDVYEFSSDEDLLSLEEFNVDVLLDEDTDSLVQLIELFEIMGSAKFVTLSTSIIEVMSMFPDELDGRSSPFTRLHDFKLNKDTPSSSTVVPPKVMAYLFGGSPGFWFNRWKDKNSRDNSEGDPEEFQEALSLQPFFNPRGVRNLTLIVDLHAG